MRVSVQFIRRLTNAVDRIAPGAGQRATFEMLKRELNGQLSWRAYERMFLRARQADEGILVDVGAARGATTVAMALGLRESATPSHLYAIDRFHGSDALAKKRNVARNVAVIGDHLARYHVADLVTVLPGTVAETAGDIPTDRPIVMISIDADGSLDRDMMALYDRMAPGCIVVLDDYEDRINKIGQRVLAFSQGELDAYEEQHRRKGLWGPDDTIADHTPLGKDLSVFRFVGQMVGDGCLERTGLIGNTWFGRKPPGAPPLNVARLAATRRGIYERFLQLRRKHGANGGSV